MVKLLLVVCLLAALSGSSEALAQSKPCPVETLRGRHVMGTVCSNSGDVCVPVAGAKVLVIDRSGRVRDEVSTNEAGGFRYDHAEQDSVWLEVRVAGFDTARARLLRARGRRAVLSLQVVLGAGGGTACGSVIREVGGKAGG